MSRAARLLIVSPIASHPADQGNAARIQAFGREMMARGLICEFLYYTAEGITPAQRDAMAGFWHALHLVPAERIGEPSLPGCWGLDDWCPCLLAERVAAMQRAGRYDALVVNYVWMSRVLEGARGALRLIDTHDLFGDRHLVARAEGLDPSWFFTTRAEEARGLARADLVLAIQEAEAAALRERSAVPVLTLGHMPPLRFLEAPECSAARAMFGYLGSANPWNAASVRALDAALAAAPDLSWLLAGQILRRRDLTLASRPLLLDPVPEAAAFYRAVDCVLNPMTGGTGLKIKTVEALAFGRPVLGTRDAFAGLPAEHPGHQARDAREVVALMRDYAASEAFRRGLRQASRLLALRQAAAVAAQHDALAERLAERI
ncbi:glycosyltransferase family 4 protein [Siccirubricoccus sp. G192]|uniref:glycosyltransferase n=1 Tax=Siccirubricoccus sp. G192 TaxID=2849651 RepID=UPI001C2C87D2|nr:glycosyltransferase family 4 protein [Siccirubricoccus sp. G192]MBV1798575.1 glycosyltransferase family 4 protein [Siccirubricoccus sp. G192]